MSTVKSENLTGFRKPLQTGLDPRLEERYRKEEEGEMAKKTREGGFSNRQNV
jgi:hypothetical protein